jgi:glycosyltransferase involved in cell wall biosynthesis
MKCYIGCRRGRIIVGYLGFVHGDKNCRFRALVYTRKLPSRGIVTVRFMQKKPIILFVVNEAYFFVSHRLPIALEARRRGYDVHIAAPRDNVWAPVGYSPDELAKHNLTFHEIPMSPFVLMLMRLAFGHHNARVIVQNTSDREFLVENGVVALENTVLIQGSGVDLDLFHPEPEPDGDPVIILPSRLIWEKGIQEFVDAAGLLRAAGVTARFVIVGNTHASNPRAVPEETLRGWAAEGIVEWWGRREDMPEVMAQCHIICLPSKYGEGVPKVLLEAAAAGRPVVATHTAGCREVVDDGVEGILVPPADSHALAVALRRLIEASAIRLSMGQAARRKAETDYGIGRIVQMTLDIYERLLPQPSNQ